ncbi:uncharacterized protein LOC142766838 [Rhipicephalus microplus]|uniref:uncharacterized protein LOC142766838 n=1 Tax=Rhipicephalus microplus TaxID=6941 RepID=UPI003F6D13F5
MKGRWTTLKAGQPVNFLSECVHDPNAQSFGSYTEVCQDPNFTEENHDMYESIVYGTLYYNRKNGQMFAYDNHTTYEQKLCRIRAEHLSFAIALAAYDVEYDDYSNVCAPINPFSEFSRLVNLKYVLLYLEYIFHVATQLIGCLQQTEYKT